MTVTQNVQDSLRRLHGLATGSNGKDESPEDVADVANVVSRMSLKDYATLAKVGVGEMANKDVDDRSYLMENIIQVAADLPTKSVLSNTLTHQFLNQLWTDLEHPPQSYLGKEYQYRKADGSGNNYLWPHIGASNQAYARSVKAEKMQPVARPDPGVVFDSLLKRKKWEPHPNKISSVLFYIASVIIHDIFHTSHEDFNKSETSSYLDLAPLYGSDNEQQKSVRTLKDGKLKPDCFADKRILGFPPGVGLLLIFFNRYHNNVVDHIAQIDENRRFSSLRRRLNPPADYDGEKEYDEALFQTARLVTSGLYINIILKDYVRTILNLNRTNSKWNLDPRSDQGKALFGEKIPEATGNQVSAEFNLIYRWHSTISQRDTRWTEDRAAQIFPLKAEGQEPTMEEFLSALQAWARNIDADPFKRGFNGLKRNEATGLFSNDDLATIWTESVEDVAGSFGANGVPQVLKMVEVLGIIQARSWNLASLNELRKYFKLQPHETFASINPDREVQDQLKRLYGHPDNVEMYPGVNIEAAKESMVPGSGLCTNFTISRAILSDAVALVRGDRFYTTDYTPQNLTNWGFNSASYNVNIDDGCVLYKLVLNALPDQYLENSIYVHYPLTVPWENEQIQKDLKREQLYDFSTPRKQKVVQNVGSFDGCKSLFRNEAHSTTSLPSLLPSSAVAHQETGKSNGQYLSHTLLTLRRCLPINPNKKYIIQFFHNVTSDLLQKHSYDLAGVQEVDIIHDVANLAQVHFAACLFALPLKTDNNPRGAFDADQLWTTLTALYTSVNTKDDPAESFAARIAGQGAVDGLAEYVGRNVKLAYPEQVGWVGWVTGALHQQYSGDLTDQSTHLIQELSKTGVEPDELAYQYLLPAAAAIVVSQARAFADCLDYILDSDNGVLNNIQRLAALDTPDADIEIENFILEALRLNTRTNIYVTVSNGIQVTNGGKMDSVTADDMVICDVYAANHDATVFEAPSQFDPKRDTNAYLPGLSNMSPIYPGQELGRPALVGMFKAVGRLSDLRRAKGPVGEMRVIKAKDGSQAYLSRDEGVASPYPSSMRVNFGPGKV